MKFVNFVYQHYQNNFHKSFLPLRWRTWLRRTPSLLDLLHTIHHTVQQTHQLIAHKPRSIALNEMPTTDCYNRAYTAAVIGEAR
jgi:hypothetical protein